MNRPQLGVQNDLRSSGKRTDPIASWFAAFSCDRLALSKCRYRSFQAAGGHPDSTRTGAPGPLNKSSAAVAVYLRYLLSALLVAKSRPHAHSLPKLRTVGTQFRIQSSILFYFPFFSSFSSLFDTRRLVLSHCHFRFSLLLFASVFYYSASLYPSILFDCYILVTLLTTSCVRFFVYHYQT